LHRTALLIAIIAGMAGSIAFVCLMIILNGQVWDHFSWLVICFLFITAAIYGLNLFLIRKFYYVQNRKIYNIILRLNEKSVGVNSIPKRIPDDQLITNIVRLVHELESSDREEIVHLKELEVFRKEFLGNVSHELKTPIFTIQGYVHTLLEGGIEDNEINLLYLQKAAKSIDRLISIVDDLESISKLEAGELILENRTFDISELVQDVIESLEFKAKETSITLTQENPDEKHRYVYADKDRIRQVLVNLLVNSIKYGRKSGNTTVRIESQDDYIIVDVIDDGIGIEKQHLGRLFERFYRVDKSRSREQGGTGLGLAIVKHIMEAHQQAIHVESEVNTGTTFSFTLKKSK
jgi:two-component system phosphate regulon sensor histidine kinase PhoR